MCEKENKKKNSRQCSPQHFPSLPSARDHYHITQRGDRRGIHARLRQRVGGVVGEGEVNAGGGEGIELDRGRQRDPSPTLDHRRRGVQRHVADATGLQWMLLVGWDEGARGLEGRGVR